MRYIPNTILRCGETSCHTIHIGTYYCPFLHEPYNNIIVPQLQKLARVCGFNVLNKYTRRS